MQVAFAAGANAEIDEARRYYAAISPQLAQDFLEATARAVRRVSQVPLMWPPLTKRIRRCLFDRFPYALISRFDGEAVYILAVVHQRQRPGYWRGR
jgi:plasmid stabilization system protein ParE